MGVMVVLVAMVVLMVAMAVLMGVMVVVAAMMLDLLLPWGINGTAIGLEELRKMLSITVFWPSMMDFNKSILSEYVYS